MVNGGDRKELARIRRDEMVDAMRDGRRNRAITIPSGKQYDRTVKHRKRVEE